MVPWFFSTKKTFFSWNASLLLSCSGLYGICSAVRPPGCALNYFFCFEFVISGSVLRSLAQLYLVTWCENGAHKPLLCLHYLWCRSFFCVFCLLVALNIMSGDLKLCRECVIVDFYDKRPRLRNTANVIFF